MLPVDSQPSLSKQNPNLEMQLTQNVKLIMILCGVKWELKSHCVEGKLASGLPHDGLGVRFGAPLRTSAGTLLSLRLQKYIAIPSAFVRVMTYQPPPALLKPDP